MSAGLTISEVLIRRVEQPENGADYVAMEDRPARVGQSPCDWLPEVQKQLQAIKNLPNGWDSHGSPSPDFRVVESAECVLQCLCTAEDLPRPHVNPTPGGGVQFEWEAGDRYFELEVLAERAATYLYCDDAAGEEKAGELFEGEFLEDVVAYIRRVAAVQ